ncbi:MAG: hypothetical protein IT562_06650 [Alphaproteobacteria bacterium]|nr:hypothetical protein [Alphaproteobacteria bacterium]
MPEAAQELSVPPFPFAIAANDDDRSPDRLAADLVRQLGVDGAINACRQNLWFGVLQAIQRQHLLRRAGR